MITITSLLIAILGGSFVIMGFGSGVSEGHRSNKGIYFTLIGVGLLLASLVIAKFLR